MIGFQPCDDKVLIRLAVTENRPPGDTVGWGEVVAVGPGRRTSDGMLISSNVAAGDRIALRLGSALDLSLNGQAFAIVNGCDVLGVLLQGATADPFPTGEAAVSRPETPVPFVQAASEAPVEESLETDIAPDLLDREAPTSEDLH
jgi:co-chaperonin GroES (HSP10)